MPSTVSWNIQESDAGENYADTTVPRQTSTSVSSWKQAPLLANNRSVDVGLSVTPLPLAEVWSHAVLPVLARRGAPWPLLLPLLLPLAQMNPMTSLGGGAHLLQGRSTPVLLTPSMEQEL